MKPMPACGRLLLAALGACMLQTTATAQLLSEDFGIDTAVFPGGAYPAWQLDSDPGNSGRTSAGVLELVGTGGANSFERVDEELSKFLEADREEDAVESAEVEAAPAATAIDSPEPASAPSTDGQAESSEEPIEQAETAEKEPLIAGPVAADSGLEYYVRAELPDASSRQDDFFENSYRAELRSMALAVLEQEAPIRDDVLARQVCRAHGFRRTGSKLKKRVLRVLGCKHTTKETTGVFLWNENGPHESIPYRHSVDEEERRSLDETPLAELVGLVRANPDLLQEDDPAVAYARHIGLGRLVRSARERLEEAIVQAR